MIRIPYLILPLIFLLFLPLSLSSISKEDYKNHYNLAKNEWTNANSVIQQINKLNPDQNDSYINLLNTAIGCYERAIQHLDIVLIDFASEGKLKKWRIRAKHVCEYDKLNYQKQLDLLLQARDGYYALENAINNFKESLTLSEEAKLKEFECSRNLTNVDDVVKSLEESSALYENASSMAHEAYLLIASSKREADKKTLQKIAKDFHDASERCHQEALEWPTKNEAQIASMFKRIADLKDDCDGLEQQGLLRGAYEIRKQIVLMLEKMVGISNGSQILEELNTLKTEIEQFETDADAKRITENKSSDFTAESVSKQKGRIDYFYSAGKFLKSDLFLEEFLKGSQVPRSLPLDGYADHQNSSYLLFTEQFYRFLIQSDQQVVNLVVTVHKEGEAVYQERIALPSPGTSSWERYITTDGLVFIPETRLKCEFGLNLRVVLFYDPRYEFSIVIAQQGNLDGYRYKISLDDSSEPLYDYTLIPPPPLQLEALRKPWQPQIEKKWIAQDQTAREKPSKNSTGCVNFSNFPLVDKVVEDLNRDPLLIAQYVYNEIDFVDPFLRKIEKGFSAPRIHRNPSITYLEGQGSPWEQCELLVYMLRRAGYETLYVTGSCSVSKPIAEKLLLTQIEGEDEVVLEYPWVTFFDGSEWISLFPWMKDMRVYEGYDLYNQMSDEFASADRWILRYLKSDEEILKHIGPDGNDTAGVLFVRFLEDLLRKKGLSIHDVGLHRSIKKKQIMNWKELPSPTILKTSDFVDFIHNESKLFAKAHINIFSYQNPRKKINLTIPLWKLNCDTVYIHFTHDDNKLKLHVSYDGKENTIDLDNSDRSIGVRVEYDQLNGPDENHLNKTLHLTRGAAAALCFNFGTTSNKIVSQYYENFENEKDESRRLHCFLSYVGNAYFEKCSSSEQQLASLHKIKPLTVFGFGLAKLSPNHSEVSIDGKYDLKMPQVDMIWFRNQTRMDSSPACHHQEIHTATRQYQMLTSIDCSSNEHQILKDIFADPNAISTVKLLQLAHLEHKKNGSPETGFLIFTPLAVRTTEENPEIAQNYHFYQIKDLNLRNIKESSAGQWNEIKSQLEENDYSLYAYAYMTPGSVQSLNGSLNEIATLINHPQSQSAMISTNSLVLHGGLGSPLQQNFLSNHTISEWKLVPSNGSYTLFAPLTPSSYDLFGKETWIWKPDVREEHKSVWNTVADPVDIVTGAFYIDEVDLSLPGQFPLQIRRNYNNQNPIQSHLGYGWKLSLNPYLIEQDGKLFAAEEDGTVIAYKFNPDQSRWEVYFEDNPDLSNFTRQGIGSGDHPFHNYIKDNVLYGSDGSIRYFEEGLLTKWMNATGSCLTFSYDQRRLKRIENSNGDFCGFYYNHEGNVSEIYVKDGRRLYYEYSTQGDLIKVVLPNGAVTNYDYDRHHWIIRETKPLGYVLENIYDTQGRVIEQRSPVGQSLKLATTALFTYEDNKTIVEDSVGAITTYKIFEKQIFKIIDPLGNETKNSWFIDSHTWFDPETEQVLTWEGAGGYPRCVKSTVDKRGLVTYYLYDSAGNPQEYGLQGSDLTGDGETHICKKYKYNNLNRCVYEESENHSTVTEYDTRFQLLPKRIERYDGDNLLSYSEFDYDDHGRLVKEDLCGAICYWEYDERSFPIRSIQVTGSDDPDVVTEFSYNNQGQCIKISAVDYIQEEEYDIMGNKIVSLIYSRTGELLSATYRGYDLSNQVTWMQGANPNNHIFFDYTPSGLIKCSRQNLTPEGRKAYTLYDYDSRNHLIQEVNPCGQSTYRTYDLLGRIATETKEDHTTIFTYEAGGLLESIISPSGSKTVRKYTTNGLLTEEIYPDGTKHVIVYDLHGRPIKEIKNEIEWLISYDDIHHKIYHTHAATNNSEIKEFDIQGNLIRYTDPAGYTFEKTYDKLGRIKTETAPNGDRSSWNYNGDTVTCTLPNGELIVNCTEAGKVVKTMVYDASLKLLSNTTEFADPFYDIKTIFQGEEITTTHYNSLGLPILTQKGDVKLSQEYNDCGQCIATTDGEGRVTRQTYDGLGRLIEKQLPDGTLLRYKYDSDSNLIEFHLPNDAVWKCSYDHMGRKLNEALYKDGTSSQNVEYTYRNGYLTHKKDSLNRLYNYQYDTYGRLVQEDVDQWQRTYSYDTRGYLSSIDEIKKSNNWGFNWLFNQQPHHSRVERTYDESGKISLESIYLNDILHQRTQQVWTPEGRSLHIGDHDRRYIYKNNQLHHVSSQNVALVYDYALNGALKEKSNPLFTTNTDRYPSGLPCKISTTLPTLSAEQDLGWDYSGRLSKLTTFGYEETFSYSLRGFLTNTTEEQYEYDFAENGVGVLTSASHCQVAKKGIDPSGKVIAEIVDNTMLYSDYDAMGQVISRGKQKLEWDPWGRLLKVTDADYKWEASYDPLGRRLQTRYTPATGKMVTTNSLYDPEQEFQEIGINIDDQTIWKMYGPSTCDALMNENGDSVYLVHNILGHLTDVISSDIMIPFEKKITPYGPQGTVSKFTTADLIEIAQSLQWQSKSQDPTGLIWMGARYYEPRNGRFLSPDPVRYPLNLDLYTYASGDPVNRIDPDGRFSSYAYSTTKTTLINTYFNPRFQGALQFVGGCVQVKIGTTLILASEGSLAPFLAGFVLHGLDSMQTGMQSMWYGVSYETLTSQLLQQTGMSSGWAHTIDDCLSMVGSMGSNSLLQSSRLTVPLNLNFATTAVTNYTKTANEITYRTFTRANFRENLKRFTGLNPSRNFEAHHVLPVMFEDKFIELGINIHQPKYGVWWEKSIHRQKAKYYNEKWAEFFSVNPEYSQEKVLELGKNLMLESGINIQF